MPGYRFEVVRGASLRLAPRVAVRTGDLAFRLLDAAGSPVANEPVEFHVHYGGGALSELDAGGMLQDVQIARASTDSAGEVAAPRFVLGPWEGPNALLVQSAAAILSHVVVGTYENTTLQVLLPLPGDRQLVAGARTVAEFQALDTGYHNEPVPDLPLELEVTAGAATIALLNGGVGCFDLRRTAYDGKVTFDVQLSHWRESVTLRAMPYLHTTIAAASLVLEARTPSLLAASELYTIDTPIGSVPTTIRIDVSDSRDAMLSPDDNDIQGLWVELTDPNNAVDLHPPAAGVADETSSFVLYSDAEVDYRLKMRLPDFPDTPALEPRGRFRTSLPGGIPRLTQPGVLPSGLRAYLLLSGGGNEDDLHRLHANVVDGAVQYLGPNAAAAPIRLQARVLAPQGRRRLVEARIKAKVRLTPFNSVTDDPAAPSRLAAGGVSDSAAGPFADTVTIPVAGAPGLRTLEFFFRSNERNYDNIVDFTADVTMEDEDADGNLYQFQEDSSIQLRSALPRPRLLVTRLEGQDWLPIGEEAIRPVTVQDALGALRPLPSDSAVYVELWCHDVGPQINCQISAPQPQRITLTKAQTDPGRVIYRSNACYLVADDRDSGLPRPTAPSGVEFVPATPGSALRAYLDREMPNNTLQPTPVRYAIGIRPISMLQSLVAGELLAPDEVTPPWLHLTVADDGTLPARFDAGSPKVRLNLRVRDALSDLSGAALANFDVNGLPGSLTVAQEPTTHGRPFARRYECTDEIEVEWGTQLLTVRARNAARGETERRWLLNVSEATNDRRNPTTLRATVRPIGAGRPPRLPVLRYLYYSGTPLGEGVTIPPVVTGAVDGVEQAPLATVRTTLNLDLRKRPSRAMHYASAPFLTVREDAVAGLAAPPPKTVIVPLGGRLQWRSDALPNKLGPFALSNRVQHRHRRTEVERKDSAGQWQLVDGPVRNGDELRVVVSLFPSQNIRTLEAKVGVADYVRRPMPGPDRFFSLLLDQVSASRYELAKYYDRQFQEQPATSLLLIDHHAPSASVPANTLGVRLPGPGRLLIGDDISGGWSEIDLPLFILPRRRAAGDTEMPQEGDRTPTGRLGALGSVVPGSGELVLSAMDRHLTSRGLPATFTRTYRSGNVYPGPLGHGWNASWNAFLWKEADDRMWLFQGDGHLVTFTLNAAGAWEPPPGFFVLLEKEHGWFRLRAPQGTSWTFLPTEEGTPGVWGLAAVEDRYGNVVAHVVPDHGRPAAVLDTLKRTFCLTWDEVAGRVRQLGDFTGSTVVYRVYPQNDPEGHDGNLKDVRSPLIANPDNPFPAGRIHRYTYKPAAEGHLLKSVNDPVGVSRAAPALLTVEYNAESRVETQTFARGTFRFAWAGDTLTWHDRRGTAHTMVLHPDAGDGWSRLCHTMSVDVNGTAITDTLVFDTQRQLKHWTHPTGRVTEYEHDDLATDPRDRGNLKVIRERPDGVRPSVVTRTMGAPDFDGAPSVVSIAEIVEQFEYEPDLQEVRTKTDALGRVFTSVWNGPFLDAERYPAVLRAATGHAVSQTREVRHEWNNWGQLLRTIDPNGVVTACSYFPESDPTAQGTAALVTAASVPAGLLGRLEMDAMATGTTRAAHLAPQRTISHHYGYNLMGLRTSFLNGRSAATEWIYNEVGEVIRVIGPEHEVTRFRYDENGRVTDRIHVVQDIAPPAGHLVLGPIEQRAHSEYDRDGLPNVSIEDADGLALKSAWEYDANGNLITESSPMVHTAVAPQATNRIRWDYDEGNRVSRETRGWGSTDPIVVEYAFDDDGNAASERFPSSGRGRDFITDGFGRQVAIADVLGNSEENLLDDVGNVTRRTVRGSIDGSPAHTGILADEVYFYDAGDRLVAQRERSAAFYPSATGGAPAEELLGQGFRRTEYWYDAGGNMVESLDPMGLRRTITPDGHGKATQVQDALGHSVLYVYDGDNQVERVEQTDPLGTSISTLSLSPSGRLLEASDYRGVAERRAYDSLGRVRYIDDALGNRTELRYDGGGRQTHKVYFLYENGRRVNSNGSENPLTQVLIEETVYNANGFVVTAYDAAAQESERREYGPNNLVSKRILPEDKLEFSGGTVTDQNPGEESESYEWRADGLLDSLTNADGQTIRHEYDLGGRLTALALDGGSTATAPGTRRVEYTLDGLGRVVAATDDNGAGTFGSEVKRFFTTFGTVCWERQRQDVTGTTHAFETRAEFRDDGTRALLSYPSGRRILRTTYNALGVPRMIADQVSNTTIAEYGWHGRMFSHAALPNGVRYGYGYDGNKELRQIRTYRGADFTDNSQLIAGVRYAYNKGGHPVEELDLKRDRVARIGFDSLNRIDARIDGYSAANPGALPASGRWWMYDASGNVLRVEGGDVTGRTSDGRLLVDITALERSSYNAANQMQDHRVVDMTVASPATSSQRLKYDRRGNLLEDETHSFTYDFRNRLVEVRPRSGTGPALRLYYDALGRCVRANERRYAFWGNDHIEEHPDGNAWYKQWVYGPARSELLAYDSNVSGSDVTLYVHPDRSGNISYLTDANGDVKERYSYDPFGTPELRDASFNLLPVSAGSGQPFLVQGRYYYQDFNLYQVGSRVHHPFFGRFLQRDPGGAMADPAAMGNPYVFAANNPISYHEDGGAVWMIPVGIYLVVTAVLAAVETKVEQLIVDKFGGAGVDWSFGGAYARNFVVGLATNWIPGGAEVREARLAAKFGYYAMRVTLATHVEYGWERIVMGKNASLGAILLGNVVGGAIGAALGRGWHRVGDSAAYQRILRTLRAHPGGVIRYGVPANRAHGVTDPLGRITILEPNDVAFRGGSELFELTLRHELGHRAWRPTTGPMWLREARGMVLGYFLERNRSHLLRALDEVIAEAHANGSPIHLARFALHVLPGGYQVSFWRAGAEAAALTVGLGAVWSATAKAGEWLADGR
jgi:RHS repeat-associated protein